MLELKFIGSGKYSDVFKVTDNRKTVVMKLSYYRDDTICKLVKNIKNADPEAARAAKMADSINVASSFGKLTNKLIERGVSPHFVVFFCEADCTNVPTRLGPLLHDRIQKSTALQLKYNHVCFMEVFTMDMTKWIRSTPLTDAQLRAAIFQVLYTLAALQHTHPSFRHNDLSTNNVLVKRLRKPMTATYKTPVGDFHIGANVNLTALVALSDYDFTHVDGIPSLTNERILSNKYKVSAAPNRTYDTHFFLKSVKKVTKNLAALAFINSLPMRPEDRLEDMVNGKIQGMVVPGLEPLALLEHSYFAPLRKRNMTDATYSFT